MPIFKSIFTTTLFLAAIYPFVNSVAAGVPVQEKAAPAKVAAKPDPLKDVEDVAGLPRVLLIGDSISMGYTIPVRELLKGKANVHRPAENCHSTKDGVERLDSWLGDKKWDVIHFNFGMHDFKHLDKDGKGVANPKDENGKPNVSPAEYEKNLRTIVARLKKTGAMLIWCSTTPLPEDVMGTAARVPGDEIKYNEIAAKIMKENNIPIDDLFAFAGPQLEKIQRAKNVHYLESGYKVLATEVAKNIEEALNK